MRPLLIGLLLLSASLTAAETPAEDEAAVRRQIQGYLDAWNRGDADALASFVDDQGDRISARAVVLSGREGIRRHYARVFGSPAPEGHKRALTYHDIAVRVVSANSAVVDAKYEVRGVGPDPTLVVRGWSSVFMVKRDGVWLRAAHRNFGPPPPSASGCARKPLREMRSRG